MPLKNYYINCENGRFLPVHGEEIDLGWPSYRFFIAYLPGSPGLYRVSELHTGGAVSDVHSTPDEALLEAYFRIREIGKMELSDRIIKAIRHFGSAPEPVNIRKEVSYV